MNRRILRLALDGRRHEVQRFYRQVMSVAESAVIDALNAILNTAGQANTALPIVRTAPDLTEVFASELRRYSRPRIRFAKTP